MAISAEHIGILRAYVFIGTSTSGRLSEIMPYATVNSHRIHYFDTHSSQSDRGDDKPPIFMIHGLGSSQNYYMSVISELNDFRCVALDSYGAARSKSNGEDLTLEALGDDVVGLMDALGVKRAVVAGHSMGGPMALYIAAAYPERVAAVVGIGPVSPKHVKPEMFTTRIETVLKDGMEPLANTIPTSATNKKSTALQRSIIRELLLNQDPKSYASHCNVICNMREPDFRSIKAPVLILAGEEDQSAPMEGCQYLHDNLSESEKSELKVMRGVGHWHCVEAGNHVAKEIAEFCSAL